MATTLISRFRNSLYGDLAKFAARKLKPGGSLLAYVGHCWLPQMFELMCPHLEYKWLHALVSPTGSYPRMHHINVFNAWRPVLWFAKPPLRKPETFVIDAVIRGKPEKEWYDWQQHLHEAVYFIDKLSAPGDLIVEPFCGAATTVLAARALGRRIIAAELDPKVANMAATRLASEEEAARAERAVAAMSARASEEEVADA